MLSRARPTRPPASRIGHAQREHVASADCLSVLSFSQAVPSWKLRPRPRQSAEVAVQDENMPQTEQAAAGSSEAVAATPSFLAPDALRALVACGKVGTVACVLSP